MAITATTWRRGQSGNPKGRPRSLNSRKALRDALLAPVDDSGSTILESWAEGMVRSAVSLEDRLAVLRFLEGATPTPVELRIGLSDDEDRRIVLPGVDDQAADRLLAEAAKIVGVGHDAG